MARRAGPASMNNNVTPRHSTFNPRQILFVSTQPGSSSLEIIVFKFLLHDGHPDFARPIEETPSDRELRENQGKSPFFGTQHTRAI